MHKFLIHDKKDHVGVAVSDIKAGEQIAGVFMEDDSTIEVVAKGDIPLGHKIAVAKLEKDDSVLKYGIPIGHATRDIQVGDYVHVHNIKTSRW